MRRRRGSGAGGRRSSGGYIVRASELGSYEYCHRSWWLREIAGAAPTTEAQSRMNRGRVNHAAHGRAVAFAPVFIRVGLLLLGLALLLIILRLAL